MNSLFGVSNVRYQTRRETPDESSPRLRVFERRDVWIASQEGPARLILVTCYPLDAWRARGDQRYAVFAEVIAAASES
jgi:hypothetical protein